jgi:hypothetical protein
MKYTLKWPSGRLYRFLSYFVIDSQSVSPSILALNHSVTPDPILTVVRQLRGWCHGASSLTGEQVYFLYSTLCWGLLHSTFPEVFFVRPSTGSLLVWVTCNWLRLAPECFLVWVYVSSVCWVWTFCNGQLGSCNDHCSVVALAWMMEGEEWKRSGLWQF